MDLQRPPQGDRLRHTGRPPSNVSLPFRSRSTLLPLAAVALLGVMAVRVSRGRRPARRTRPEALAKAVFDHSGEAIFVTDDGRRIVSVNPAFTAITGYPAAEAVGRDARFLGAEAAGGELLAALFGPGNETGHGQGEVDARRRDGEVFPLWLAVTELRDAHGRLRNYIAIGSDISERKTAEERIQYLAHHDVLTGLPNRLLLRDRLEQVLVHVRRARSRAAVLFLDLDRFKRVNDSLGHPAGDELLKQVAERLRACVRLEDTISRQGGDEFLLVLGDLRDPEDAVRVSHKIGEAIARPYFIEGRQVRITASIGIALVPEAGADADTLIRHADAAMYDAKAGGRDTFRLYSP